MAGLVGFLRRLLDSLFSGSGSKTGMKQIHTRLRSMKPSFFRPRGLALLPGFAQQLYQLHTELDPLALIFRYTLAHEEQTTATRFVDWLVEARLPDNITARRISFTYKEMKSRLAREPDQSHELSAIYDDYTRYLDALEGPAYQAFDDMMAHTQRLAGLSRYRFLPLLKKFDPNLDPGRTDYHPSFHELSAEGVLEDILDFAFLVAPLRITEQVRRNTHFLAQRVYREQGYDSDALDKRIDRVMGILETSFSREALTDLLRAVHDDVDFEPRIDLGGEKYLNAFKLRLTEAYERDRDRLQREVSRSAMQRDVSALFDGADLLGLEGYNEEEAALISHRELESFAYIFPMRILKSFVFGKYETGMKDYIKKLLVDGSYSDRDFQEEFSGTMFQCDAMAEQIRGFEGAFGHGNRFDLRLIHDMLDAHRQGKTSVELQVKKKVRVINREARNVLEQGANCHHKMGGYLKVILEDYKSRNPEKITNIRVIAGERNSTFVKGVLTAYKDIQALVNVLKNYTVIEKDMPDKE